MTDLQTEVPRAQRVEPVRLPWHLRKRFLLPVVTMLLLGAFASVTLLAAAVYTYVRVSQAVEELQGELSQLGLLPAVSTDTASAAPTVLPEAAPMLGVGDAGEAGRVRYVVEGDLDDVTATWAYDASGATKTEKLAGTEESFSYMVDGTWALVGIEAHRERGRGSITCSLLGEGDVVLDTQTAEGSGASVACSL